MRKACLIILLAAMLVHPLKSQVIRTVTVEFEREFDQEGKSERISGQIFYQAPNRTTVKIDNPVDQWVIFENNRMTLFYPKSNLALLMVYEFPIHLPYFFSFLNSAEEGFGLSAFHCKLLRWEKEDRLLRCWWQPPEAASSKMGPVFLEYDHDKLRRAEISDSKGKPLSRSEFKNHQYTAGGYFPLEIITTYTRSGGESNERVIYRNLILNSPLPREVLEFRIPANATIQVMEM